VKRTVITLILLATTLLAGIPAADLSAGGDESALGKIAYKQKHYPEALAHFQKAAKLGNVNAQLNIAAMYERGRGVERDMDKAAYWYRLAAANGDTDAQCILGSMYHLGRGVEKNDTQAIKWLQLAATQGSSRAQTRLELLCKKSMELCE
jgi:TPR repeat protein